MAGLNASTLSLVIDEGDGDGGEDEHLEAFILDQLVGCLKVAIKDLLASEDVNKGEEGRCDHLISIFISSSSF